MKILTITHTHEEGTLITGTSRGDGTAEILKAQGWKWGRSISSWYVPYSRDRLVKTWVVTQTVRALEAAGFTVETEISMDRRTTTEVEEDRVRRADDRADALAAKADRRHADYETAQARADQAFRCLPPMGEPIKIGHHSEARHRRDLEKARTTMVKAIDAHKEAERADQRARTAAGATTRRYAPITVHNRIEKLMADIRSVDRKLAGERRYHSIDDSMVGEFRIVKPEGEYLDRLLYFKADYEDQLAYWQQIRDEQKAHGIRSYGPDDICKGDYVLHYSTWYEVVRVNKKTVTVQTDYSWTETIPYINIQDIKRNES